MPTVTVLERLRQVAASAKPAAPAELAGAIEQVEAALAGAQAKAGAVRERHAGALLALIAADDVKGLAKGREQLAGAEARVAELHGALNALRERLAQAQAAQERNARQAQWARAERLLDERAAAVARLQACADAFAAALRETAALSDQAWAALPEVPGFRPAGYGRDLATRVGLYLLGATDGRLGSGAVSPHVARLRPDLVRQDREARAVLLQPLAAVSLPPSLPSSPPSASPSSQEAA